MKIFTIALTTFLLLVISACGYNPLRDKDCSGCDLSGANLSKVFLVETNLTGANLAGANLTGADLTNANLTGADLDGVHGGDFSGALGIPAEYR